MSKEEKKTHEAVATEGRPAGSFREGGEPNLDDEAMKIREAEKKKEGGEEVSDEP